MTDADVRGYRLEMYRDPEDGSWVAEVPDLPGCVGGGQSAEEAVEMAADAIEAWIDAASASGRAVPLPRTVDEEHSGHFVLRVPKRLHAQLARVARREGVSMNLFCSTALAEAVGATEVRRAYSATRFAVPEVQSVARVVAPENASYIRVGGLQGVIIGPGTIRSAAATPTIGKVVTQ